jgi:hypothetical protein
MPPGLCWVQTAPIMDWQARIRPAGYSQFYAYKTLAAILVPKLWPMPTVRERVTFRVVEERNCTN